MCLTIFPPIPSKWGKWGKHKYSHYVMINSDFIKH